MIPYLDNLKRGLHEWNEWKTSHPGNLDTKFKEATFISGRSRGQKANGNANIKRITG